MINIDHQLVQTVANRIIELTPEGASDYLTTYDEYLENNAKQSGK
jgi:ATPase subunit of ABC transporter with duplicated ATPase domains